MSFVEGLTGGMRGSQGVALVRVRMPGHWDRDEVRSDRRASREHRR